MTIVSALETRCQLKKKSTCLQGVLELQVPTYKNNGFTTRLSPRT